MLTQLTKVQSESAAKAPLNFYHHNTLNITNSNGKSDQADAEAEELPWDLEELLQN